MSTTTERQYCGGCYGAAEKAGRPVRKTDVYDYPLCGLCEGRVRNGLIQYHPSNGTEFDYFLSTCERCRHFDGGGLSDHRVKACAWGVLDKLLNGMSEPSDSGTFWFDPADLATHGLNGELICPARCLRFTGRNDADGNLRDPPPRDCEGQMFLGDLLTVPERVPQKETVR